LYIAAHNSRNFTPLGLIDVDNFLVGIIVSFNFQKSIFAPPTVFGVFAYITGLSKHSCWYFFLAETPKGIST
jgi:TRAP-type mannitol/chloroaromatic compound transport system permease large subunit